MKDNNLNNSKNVEKVNIFYKPDGQMTKYVYELLKNSKEGNYNNLKQLTEEIEFQGSTLNLALRNLIICIKPENPNHIKCLRLLLSNNIDLNYKYQKENNSTLLMEIFKKYELSLMKEFLENIKININNNLSNEEKEKIEISEKQMIFTQKDSNNNNFLHFLDLNNNKNELFSILEYIYDKYPYSNNSKIEISNKIKEIIKSLSFERNNDGNTVFNISLFQGLHKFILKLISEYGYISNINSSGIKHLN